MTAPIVPRGTGGRTRPKTDVAQLWSGGVATAIVAGLAALVGVLAWRWPRPSTTTRAPFASALTR